MLLHWMMASLLRLLYITGVYVAHPPQVNFIKWLSPFLHQSIGTLFLLLLVARIFLLLRVIGSKYSRRLPTVSQNWLKTTALHTVLYLFMLIVPLTGFFLRNHLGVNTTCFGISVPSVVVANDDLAEPMRSAHFWASYMFLVFIGLHMLAHWRLVRSRLRRFFPVSKKTYLPDEIAAITTKPVAEPLAQKNSTE